MTNSLRYAWVLVLLWGFGSGSLRIGWRKISNRIGTEVRTTLYVCMYGIMGEADLLPAACFLRIISATASLSRCISEPLLLFFDFYRRHWLACHDHSVPTFHRLEIPAYVRVGQPISIRSCLSMFNRYGFFHRRHLRNSTSKTRMMIGWRTAGVVVRRQVVERE